MSGNGGDSSGQKEGSDERQETKSDAPPQPTKSKDHQGNPGERQEAPSASDPKTPDPLEQKEGSATKQKTEQAGVVPPITAETGDHGGSSSVEQQDTAEPSGSDPEASETKGPEVSSDGERKPVPDAVTTDGSKTTDQVESSCGQQTAEPSGSAPKLTEPIDHKVCLGIDIIDTQEDGTKAIDYGTPPDKEEANQGIDKLFDASQNEGHAMDWSPITMLACSLGSIYSFYYFPGSGDGFNSGNLSEVWSKTFPGKIWTKNWYDEPKWNCFWIAAIPYVSCLHIFITMIHFPEGLIATFLHSRPRLLQSICVSFNFWQEILEIVGFSAAGKQSNRMAVVNSQNTNQAAEQIAYNGHVIQLHSRSNPPIFVLQSALHLRLQPCLPLAVVASSIYVPFQLP